MAEYIERSKIMDALLYEQYGYLCEDAINAIPAADVREVVRGEWIVFDGRAHCNRCGLLPEHISKFCPNCGADMRIKHETVSK